MSELSDRAVEHLRNVVEQPDLVAGRYEIIEVVGRGGMGIVYRAHDPLLGRDVALKVLNAHSQESGFAERLRREARVLAHLEHPGIVPVYDAGVFDDGRVYYVMRFVRGTRLDKLDATKRGRGEVMRHFLRICEAVAFAHERGVVHRDLKPGNVMITPAPGNEALVLDWGIARLRGAPDADTDQRDSSSSRSALLSRDPITGDGAVMGTPGFMAPEQESGRIGDIDQRTDVFGLGAILRELLRSGNDPAPRPLLSIATCATALEPGDRYSSAGDLAEDVRRWMDGEAVLRHKERPFEKLARLYRRYQPLILLLLAYGLMRLAFFIWRGI